MGKPKVATVWLEGCAGCHMSFLDLDEALVDILDAIDLTISPITDFKDYEFPELEVGIVEGGVGNHEQKGIAVKLRKRCKVLMAWGDCAVFGGINTMRNWIPKEEILSYAYLSTPSSCGGSPPSDSELPELLEKVLPLNQVVRVDAYVPGCPPSPEAIAQALKAVLAGRIESIPVALLHFD